MTQRRLRESSALRAAAGLVGRRDPALAPCKQPESAQAIEQKWRLPPPADPAGLGASSESRRAQCPGEFLGKEKKRKERAGAPGRKGNVQKKKIKKKSPSSPRDPGPLAATRDPVAGKKRGQCCCCKVSVVSRLAQCCCCCYCAAFYSPAESGNRQLPNRPRFLQLGRAKERWLLLRVCCIVLHCPVRKWHRCPPPSYLGTKRRHSLYSSVLPLIRRKENCCRHRT